MAIGRRIGRFFVGLFLVLGLALWIIALLLFSQVAEPSDDFANNATPILVINAIGVSILVALIINRLVRLVRDYRRFVPGSRLETRIVSLVVIISAVPLGVLYLFSLLFISKGIDEWFPVDVDEGVREAVTLAREAIERDDLATLRRFAGPLRGDLPSLSRQIARAWPGSGAVEMALFSAAGGRLELFSETADTMVPPVLGADLLAELQLAEAQETDGFASLELLPNETHEVHAAVRVAPENEQSAILWARFPLDARINERILLVQSVGDDLSLLEETKTALEWAFMLSLSLVLLVAILGAVYTSFSAARRLVSPIQQLMQGTRAVARGDYDTRVPLARRDEIGFLVNSFNDMTQRLAMARQEAHDSEMRLEEERSKLEVILARLSTGVVSLEPDLTIRTANQAAGDILGVGLEAHVGESLTALASRYPQLGELVGVSTRHIEAGRTEWREQITLRRDLGNRELVCACSTLPAEGELGSGFVIVFDDITALIRAQREAAWGEVARRLAHEIKNPLTPIQLSAERMRRRYLTGNGDSSLELLDRATHTIIQQVDAMKGMVDAFSEYARVPDIDLMPLDLNAVVGEVTELYRHQVPPVSIRMDLDRSLPEVEADIGRLRQIMHNLMRNASEAVEGQDDAEIGITTRRRELPEGEYVEIVVSDNGPGFAADIIDQAFLPYVTSKAKGTGLGLAIVRKLVEEHGGQIHAGNKGQRGAEVSILLPLPGFGRAAGSERRSQHRRKRA